MSRKFIAILRGSEEVPPVVTAASGNAVFRLSRDKTKLHFRLTVNNLKKFTQAHIHLGPRGQNGPIVAFLFGLTVPGISVTKGVVTGTITRKDLVGPLRGKPLSALIEEMRRGNTYANAHTERQPAGEIRGQIRVLLK